MHSLKWIVLVGCGVLAIVGSGISYSQSAEPEDRLYGSWECEVASDEEGVKMSMEYNITYGRDGTATGSGTLWLKTGQLPEMRYAIETRSEWAVSDGELIETATDIEAINESHPHLDRLFNLRSVIPEDASDSSEILRLDESRLRTQSGSYGTIRDCVRNS